MSETKVISETLQIFVDCATAETGMELYTGGRMSPTREEIAQLAYYFYELRGRQNGHDLEDWLRAEQELVHHYA